jgi:hypothetical protein
MQLDPVSCLIRLFTYGWNQVELYQWNYYAESDDVQASETASEHTQYIKKWNICNPAEPCLKKQVLSFDLSFSQRRLWKVRCSEL